MSDDPHDVLGFKESKPFIIRFIGGLPFLACHLLVFAAFWTGVTVPALITCVALFAIRTFAVTAGYHRYFSHRTFETSRPMQFALAFLAQTSAQKGVLWWAAHHRHHHKHSDTEEDVHPPGIKGFWYAHFGWIFDDHDETRFHKVPDLVKYPELVWLNRVPLLPAVLLAVACWWFMGWPGLVVGFFWSTVALWHNTFFINSLTHMFGTRRYETGDESRNSLILGLLTFGEGWHNNHHHYPAATRQGFFWWEIDITYYILKAMSWVGLVWNLREVPEEILEEGRRRDAGEAVDETEEGDLLPAEVA